MNSQPPPQENSEKTQTNLVKQNSSEIDRQQLHNLQLEVERIYVDVNQLRKLLQTLVTGLIIAIFLALGISIWFAYRLLLQEKIAQQKLQDATATATELLAQVEELKQQIQLQDQQIETIRQQVSENLTKSIDENQAEIKELGDRLSKLETKN